MKTVVVYFEPPYTPEGAVENALSGAGGALHGQLAICYLWPPNSEFSLDCKCAGIEDAELFVVDFARSSLWSMYLIGLAHGRGKSVIVLCENDTDVPVDWIPTKMIVNKLGQPPQEWARRLGLVLMNAIEHPEDFMPTALAPKPKDSRPTVFISYSRADRKWLTRLLVHLKPVEREKLLDVWADTRIAAGEKWKAELAEALERAAVAVLLVSADFLASDFIATNELPPLLEAARTRGTMILPLILSPCRFQRHKTLSQFQTINPPNSPLMRLSASEQEEWLATTVERVEQVLSPEGAQLRRTQ